MQIARLGTAGRVLIVEDDPDVRDAMADVLESEGYRVERAVNGRDALRLLREGPPPDAVVLDLMMPVMDGWQFRLEQRRDPAAAVVPVIALSADHSSRAQAVDADAFLQKPVESTELLRTVGDLVQAGRARREEAERLAHTERLTTLGHLAAAVAHEINNPLVWLLGNLRIITERLEDPESLKQRLSDTQAAAREALEGAERIQEIVSDIRVFTRKMDEPEMDIELTDAIDGLLRLLDRQIAGRATIVRRWSEPVRVRAPAGRLRQVLLNLIVNALDALPPDRSERNEIQIELRSEAGRIRVIVGDNGTGIAEGILPRIFDPFFTTKDAGKGTGLGLFVCRGLITAMGSELHVESRVGHGTRFWFWLKESPRSRESESVSAQPPLGPMTVLVVDDEPGVIRALQRQLGDHRVIGAASAEEALALLDAGTAADLILSDLYMPGMGGRGLYFELQRRGDGLESRMAFMTAGFLDEETLQFAQARSDRVLQKPAELGEVLTLLARFGRGSAGIASELSRVARLG